MLLNDSSSQVTHHSQHQRNDWCLSNQTRPVDNNLAPLRIKMENTSVRFFCDTDVMGLDTGTVDRAGTYTDALASHV